MAHGNVDSMKATAQNAVTDPETSGPNDKGRDESAEARREPRSYTAADVRDATVAAPAAGEMSDYADLDEPSGGMAQGRTHTNREAHAHTPEQGPKTQKANRDAAAAGSPDQGTH